MILEQTVIDQINAKLAEAEKIRYGEIVVRFIRHGGRFVKIRLESHNKDAEQIYVDDTIATNEEDNNLHQNSIT